MITCILAERLQMASTGLHFEADKPRINAELENNDG